MAEENKEQTQAAPAAPTAPQNADEQAAGQTPKQFEIAILPLQNTTLFPGTDTLLTEIEPAVYEVM